MDGDMDPSSCRYHHTCELRFGESATILGHHWAQKEVIVHWLRLQTLVEWFPHPLHTYAMCMTTFICNGWRYGSVIMPLPPHLLVQICKIGWKPWLWMHTEWYPLCGVWASKPIWHGSHIHSKHIQGDWQPSYAVDGGIWIWIGHHTFSNAITSTIFGPDVWSQLKSWVTAGHQVLLLCSIWGSNHKFRAFQIMLLLATHIWRLIWCQ